MGKHIRKMKEIGFFGKFDLKRIKPYGDSINDGKIQISFTLPLPNTNRATIAAKRLSKKMGLKDIDIVFQKSLESDFTFFIVYGVLVHSVDVSKVAMVSHQSKSMNMEEIDEFIREHLRRKVIVLGATTGTDSHTVGIDAIMSMKGYHGHHGLERYEMIETYNLGSQVLNEEFVRKAINLNADVLLVSQTVTQKGVHVKNLSNLVELLEAEGIRDKVVLICGGARISKELAKELGYDAGFGSNTVAEDVATFFVKELVQREKMD
ncbi:MAG: cobalamin-dependent protein [Candidatus Lokiarchaeota archaeon]|nr:cobalamin-dependent protein [Candidatus Lokiarchaeota archaeon]